jgi:hypothetical protein
MNAINVIAPDKRFGTWVFDDPRVGLVHEPFVAGADDMIDRVVADIPDAEHGFTLIFSTTPFPGYKYRLDWRREEGGGNWYYSAQLDMEGWLCPALFRYFPEAPNTASTHTGEFLLFGLQSAVIFLNIFFDLIGDPKKF